VTLTDRSDGYRDLIVEPGCRTRRRDHQEHPIELGVRGLMASRIPISCLTLFHSAMGACLGGSGAIVAIGLCPAVTSLSTATDVRMTVFAVMSLLAAVGAGLSGFILISVERSRGDCTLTRRQGSGR
jgi:hypothetical protein